MDDGEPETVSQHVGTVADMNVCTKCGGPCESDERDRLLSENQRMRAALVAVSAAAGGGLDHRPVDERKRDAGLLVEVAVGSDGIEDGAAVG
jgi:hypothetical protein